MNDGLQAAVDNAMHLIYSGKVKVFESQHKLGDLSTVVPHIYISNRETALNVPLLKKHRITMVISVTDSLASEAQQLAYTLNGISYLHLSLQDVTQQPLFPTADLVNTALQPYVKKTSARGRALVHCEMGVSRSVSVVIWHLMCTYKWSYDQCLVAIRKHRSFVCPNAGFELQLRNKTASSDK